jgi:hypothetical protein
VEAGGAAGERAAESWLKIEKDFEAPLVELMGVLEALLVGVEGVAGEERSWCLKEKEGVRGEAAEDDERGSCLGGVCRRMGEEELTVEEGELGAVSSLVERESS